MHWTACVLAVVLGGTLAACTHDPVAAHDPVSAHRTTPAAPTRKREPTHIVVVVMENRSYAEIVHNRDAPYLNALLAQSANFSDFHAETHPSLPNYLALFSGSTHRLRSDSCHHLFHTDNLGDEVIDAGLTFTAYTEGLPGVGIEPCMTLIQRDTRAREPWTDFADVPATLNQPFSAFPHNYAQLPALSFVIPNLQNSMHSGRVARGDHWLGTHIAAYATWARSHDSWLVITWDEDNRMASNHIPTLVTGAGVEAGTFAQPVDHYDLLRTIEVALRLPAIGSAIEAPPIAGMVAR